MPRRALKPLSYLDAPLDELLGQVSHVRILRVLSSSRHAIPPSELARATRLDLSGVVRSVGRLTQLGILRALGAGSRRLVELNPAHAFAPVLLALFEAERQRRQELVTALQALVESVTPTPLSVWIEGAHATGTDTADDLLKVGVLTTVRERHAVIEQLQTRLSDIEQRFDVTVDLLVRTRADLETMTSTQQDVVRSGIVVYGPAPLPPTSQSTTGPAGASAITHADVDALSEEKAARVAKAIANDPRLIERAQRWIEQRRPHASDAELHELREWERILSRPPHRIAAFLRDPGERATRLRQTSPFVGFTEAKRGRRGRQ